MKVLFILLTTALFIQMGRAQNTLNTLDFWLGSWDAYWNDSLKGSNTIARTLNNSVLEENFSLNDKSFVGKSWSVFDTTNKIWRQTWVDNTGAYLTFTGGAEGSTVILKMVDKRTKNGKSTSMRMVFFNIKKDSFDWDWQSSEDEKNWKSMWLISYKRKK